MRALSRLPIRRPLLALSSLALAATLAACSSGKPSSTGSSGTSTAASDNGQLEWAWATPTSWDPVTSSAGTDVTDLQLVYSALTSLNQDGDAEAGLATSWQYLDNGLILQFQLRQGVTFTDGTPFNATAVQENIQRGQTDPKSLIAPQLADISSVSVVNPYEVDLHLAKPEYDLPLVLAGKTGEMVSPTAFTKNAAALTTAPVGSGPFKLVSYVPQESAVLVRNPDYFAAADFHLAKVTIENITTPATALAGLESGSLNLASLYTGQLNSAATASGLDVNVFPNLRVVDLQVNQAMAPFNNPLVVQAISDALDRTALAKTQTFGVGQADDEPFPPGYVAYDPAVANYYSYDPAKAKALLAQAGYPNGLSITLSSSSSAGSGGDPLAEQIQAELKAVGINVTIASIPTSEVSQLVYVQHTIAFNDNQLAGRESPLQMLNVAYSPTGLLNGGRSATPKVVQSLAAAALVPLDSTQWQATIRAATDATVEQGSDIMLYTVPFVVIHSSKVLGLQKWIVSQSLEGVSVEG